MPGLSNIQTQVQSQTQVQTLSPQQVLEARLLELNTLELESLESRDKDREKQLLATE